MEITDSSLRPTYDEYFCFFVEQNLVGFLAVMLVSFYGHLEMHMARRRTIVWKHDVIHKTTT